MMFIWGPEDTVAKAKTVNATHTKWDWLSEDETRNFESFIKFLRTDYAEKIREVILLGDIL